MKKCGYKLNLCQPAIYQIEVVGHLNSKKATWVENLTTSNGYSPDGTPITIITGEVADQTALHGLLNRIYNLGLPLLSVIWLGSNSDTGMPA
jgi:hypothetical protein